MLTSSNTDITDPPIRVGLGEIFDLRLSLRGEPRVSSIKFPGLIQVTRLDPSFLQVEGISWNPGELGLLNPYLNLKLKAISPGETVVGYTAQLDSFNPEFFDYTQRIEISGSVLEKGLSIFGVYR